MGSYQVTLAADTPSSFVIPGACSRFQVTLLSAVSQVWVTTDGSGPYFPTNAQINSGVANPSTGVINSAGQRGVPAVLGVPVSLQGNQPGSGGGPGAGGTAATQVQMLSAGTPTVLVEW